MPGIRLLIAVTVVVTGVAAQAPLPNVVILYTDDMGAGDLGCYGATDIRTPNIDALARSGVRLAHYYSAAPICAPSRAALLTGRYPTRAGMSTKRNIPSRMNVPGMSATEMTIADLAQQRGYATAVIGKWHLGSTHATQPNARGFDFFFGHHASCIDSYSHWYYAGEPYYHDLYRNRAEIHKGGQHMTDLITRETVRFIDRNVDRPFLIYVAYNTPHYPMVSPPRFLQMVEHLPEPRRRHAALVTHIDQSVGAIMDHLRRCQLTQQTLVVLASDNGEANKSPRGEGGGSNAPFREYKRSLFDGGIHVPGIVAWPGTVPAGQIRAQLAIAMDVFATVAEAIGAELPSDRVIDGRSWLPMLADPHAPGHDALLFEWDGQHAVRQGKWKVVRNGLIDQHASRRNRAKGGDFVFLSDLEADPGERVNLRSQFPEVADRLLQLHDTWRTAIAADPTASTAQGQQRRQPTGRSQ